MNKEITVTLTDKSHKHAEMMIHKAVNPNLVAFVHGNDGEWTRSTRAIPWWGNVDYFLCQPDHEYECLHWLNGGDVEFRIVVGNERWNDYPIGKEWEENIAFMREGLEFLIKQESEFVNVESVFDLNKEEQYYCNSTGKSYDPIGQYPSEQYLVAQLEQNNLYRKVEKGGVC